MNILQRFAAETPAEAQKAQKIFLVLAAVVVKVATYHIVPVSITNDAFAALCAVAAFAQFAAKDAAMLEEIISHPLTLITDIPSVISQISEIHAAIKTQAPATESAGQILTQIEQIAAPSAPPVVNVPV